MDQESKRKLVFGFKASGLIGMIVGAAWTAWHFCWGPVPLTEEILVNDGNAIVLPFPVSRWADIPMAMLFCAGFCRFVSKVKGDERDAIMAVMSIGSYAGGFFGLVQLATGGGFIATFIAGLTIVLFFILKTSEDLLEDIKHIFLASFSIAIGYSIFHLGLAAGIILGIYSGVISVPIYLVLKAAQEIAAIGLKKMPIRTREEIAE